MALHITQHNTLHHKAMQHMYNPTYLNAAHVQHNTTQQNTTKQNKTQKIKVQLNAAVQGNTTQYITIHTREGSNGACVIVLSSSFLEQTVLL